LTHALEIARNATTGGHPATFLLAFTHALILMLSPGAAPNL